MSFLALPAWHLLQIIITRCCCRMHVLADAPFLALWYVKVAVLLLFLAYAILSFVGIYRLTYGQPLSDLAPDGSYLQKYDAVNQVMEARPPTSMELVMSVAASIYTMCILFGIGLCSRRPA